MLHQQTTLKTKRTKRIARGGKRGTMAGRGQKGQKSRAGHRIRPALRELIERIPKKRGFANKPTTEKPYTVNIGELSKKALAQNVQEVNLEALRALGFIGARYKGKVKVLSMGTVAGKLTITGLLVSEAAKAKIEAAGGTVA